MKPLLASGSPMRSLMMPMTISSDTSAPDSITAFALSPIGVRDATAARSMSPVDSCGTPRLRTRRVRLRALARARRSEQNQPHRFRPFNLALRISPSY